VDDQAAWVWVGSLRLVPGLEKQVAVVDIDENAG